MSNNELQLFVFEGGRAESKYVEKLEQHFLGKRISVKCVYDAEIYQLYASDCRPDLCNINKYTNDVWQELIYAHVSKMNYLVNELFAFPEKTELQNTIFESQLEKHIKHKCPMVAVLSAFPIYVLDYFGVNTLKKKLDRYL